MGAVVSTGDLTWEVVVKGQIPKNNERVNLAMRWEQPRFTTNEEYNALLKADTPTEELGGLQVKISLFY